jgi:hypothetical protein
MFQETLERLKGLGGGFTKGIGQSSGLEFEKGILNKPSMKKPGGKKKSQIETLLEQLARR